MLYRQLILARRCERTTKAVVVRRHWSPLPRTNHVAARRPAVVLPPDGRIPGRRGTPVEGELSECARPGHELGARAAERTRGLAFQRSGLARQQPGEPAGRRISANGSLGHVKPRARSPMRRRRSPWRATVSARASPSYSRPATVTESPAGRGRSEARAQVTERSVRTLERFVDDRRIVRRGQEPVVDGV